MMKLYGYFRSSAAYRVRIALELKKLDWESIPVNLLHAEQQSEAFRDINPQGLVPALEYDGQVISQSLAIMEWLDETFPSVSLLPSDPLVKAQVRALAYQIAIEVHPLNNLRVLKYLQSELNVEESQKLQWYQHWVEQGFGAFERSLLQYGSNGQFCIGDRPTLADICLIPQVYNAKRFNCDLSPYPMILSVSNHCSSLAPFIIAAPESQADCPN